MRKILFGLFTLFALALPATACDRDVIEVRSVQFVPVRTVVFERDVRFVREVQFVRRDRAVQINRSVQFGLFPFFSFERSRTVIR